MKDVGDAVHQAIQILAFTPHKTPQAYPLPIIRTKVSDEKEKTMIHPVLEALSTRNQDKTNLPPESWFQLTQKIARSDFNVLRTATYVCARYLHPCRLTPNAHIPPLYADTSFVQEDKVSEALQEAISLSHKEFPGLHAHRFRDLCNQLNGESCHLLAKKMEQLKMSSDLRITVDHSQSLEYRRAHYKLQLSTIEEKLHSCNKIYKDSELLSFAQCDIFAHHLAEAFTCFDPKEDQDLHYQQLLQLVTPLVEIDPEETWDVHFVINQAEIWLANSYTAHKEAQRFICFLQTRATPRYLTNLLTYVFNKDFADQALATLNSDTIIRLLLQPSSFVLAMCFHHDENNKPNTCYRRCYSAAFNIKAALHSRSLERALTVYQTTPHFQTQLKDPTDTSVHAIISALGSPPPSTSKS